MAQQRGTIAQLVTDRGFGFIRGTASDVDYFFHRSALVEGSTFATLHIGQAVTFEAADGVKGPRASKVAIA